MPVLYLSLAGEGPLVKSSTRLLRGETMRAMPFFSQKELVVLLDRLPGMEPGERTAFDQVLMHLVSLCMLQEGFGVSSGKVHESPFSSTFGVRCVFEA